MRQPRANTWRQREEPRHKNTGSHNKMCGGKSGSSSSSSSACVCAASMLRAATLVLLALCPAPTESFIIAPFRATHHYSPTRLLAKSGKKKKKPKDNTICVNRQARRNYEIIDTLEAGISLVGTEMKSIRQGKMNLVDGYVRPSKNGRECDLFNVHISKHSQSAEYFNHEERRPRKLLVHKEEARRLLQQTERAGMTIVPLKAYFNEQNRVKIQIGVCRGKNVRDKRQDIKAREAKREGQRMMKSFRIS